MSWQNNLAKIGFRDRKQQCDIFRAMLHQETSHRGMVLHSNGQGGAGKSILLNMFEDMCGSPNLPLTTRWFYFTPDSLSMINWQAILDTTVEQLGKDYFTRYTELRLATSDMVRRRNYTTGSNSQTVYVHETHIHNVQGAVHTGSGDIRAGSIESGGQSITEIHHRGPVEEIFSSQEEIRQQLTLVFLNELNHLPHLGQVVWLVDGAEKLDEATKEWLIKLLGGIAQQKTQRLILVVAGRDRLRYESRWSNHVVDLEIGYFTIDTVMEIILEFWPEHDLGFCIEFAEMLLERTKGDPQQTIAAIERCYNRRVFL